MTIRLLLFCWLVTVLLGCSTDRYLDSSIPRVTTPLEQIATIRTTWVNGELRQTTFIDKQNRVLEDFTYGLASWKTLNRYQDEKKISSAYYYHSDSSTPGFITISKYRYVYDDQGRVNQVTLVETEMGKSGLEKFRDSSKVYYEYTGQGDTLFTYSPSLKVYESIKTNINRWERNEKGQLVRNFRLYVIKPPNEPRLDTLTYYSHRFSYDSQGRRTLAWFDLMYLGLIYSPPGPDTIQYFYDSQNRLVQEKHIYSIDKRNKVEIDTTSLDKHWRNNVAMNRRNFFAGRDYFPKNAKIEYRYEVFDPVKHLPLKTP